MNYLAHLLRKAAPICETHDTRCFLCRQWLSCYDSEVWLVFLPKRDSVDLLKTTGEYGEKIKHHSRFTLNRDGACMLIYHHWQCSSKKRVFLDFQTLELEASALECLENLVHFDFGVLSMLGNFKSNAMRPLSTIFRSRSRIPRACMQRG